MYLFIIILEDDLSEQVTNKRAVTLASIFNFLFDPSTTPKITVLFGEGAFFQEPLFGFGGLFSIFFSPDNIVNI